MIPSNPAFQALHAVINGDTLDDSAQQIEAPKEQSNGEKQDGSEKQSVRGFASSKKR
jgi:hypothetical protein